MKTKANASNILLLLFIITLLIFSFASYSKAQKKSSNKTIAKVKVGDKWGYIDKTGKYVINPHFDGAGDFKVVK